ncbi:hypothetical protein BpHYR1_025616 [Brachionus plicatilis]|uniref:Uncharacterized protein n=1 Tax=Brachionus plicatilis TaxID=10195 RepID=A0A3M7SU44_BRAPC|nr:hypothetical protein BpHYR1_025616 [Brachionus plicatilis]
MLFNSHRSKKNTSHINRPLIASAGNLQRRTRLKFVKNHSQLDNNRTYHNLINVFPRTGMPVWKIVSLFRALISTAGSIRVLSCMNSTAISFIIFIQYLISSKQAHVSLSVVTIVIVLPRFVQSSVHFDISLFPL